MGIINGIMIWPYDIMKEKMYITFGQTCANVPIALSISVFLGSSLSISFDNIKTRMQNSYYNKNLNRINYLNSFDLFNKAIRNEGIKTFLSGFIPLYSKLYLYSLSV